MAPLLRLTVSTTSTNASFFLYLTSARLQLVAPVAWVVIFDDSSYSPISVDGNDRPLVHVQWRLL